MKIKFSFLRNYYVRHLKNLLYKPNFTYVKPIAHPSAVYIFGFAIKLLIKWPKVGFRTLLSPKELISQNNEKNEG
jgi:hypothetical protein